MRITATVVNQCRKHTAIVADAHVARPLVPKFLGMAKDGAIGIIGAMIISATSLVVSDVLVRLLF